MKANEHQVGGIHYSSGYQHWDLVIHTGMGYLEGQVTRYIARWRKKDGLQDLQKALHYIDKMLEVALTIQSPRLRLTTEDIRLNHERAQNFSRINGLGELEYMVISTLVNWDRERHLQQVRDYILALMAAGEPKPVPASDSNKHADRAEEHS